MLFPSGHGQLSTIVLLSSGMCYQFPPLKNIETNRDDRSSVGAVKEHDTRLLKKLGEKFNLTYTAFGSRISQEGAPASGSLTLSDAYNGSLEPAPVTPTGADAAPYQLLSGTIKATYNAHRSIQTPESEIIVAPSMMSGNTGMWLIRLASRLSD